MRYIGIIGGGASGALAALKASENAQNFIYLFEKNPRILKKLMATGNGRCNMTNSGACAQNYGETEGSLLDGVLKRFSVPDTLAYFEALGLYAYEDRGGRVYPRSNQAASVADALRFALQRENICVLTEHTVQQVEKKDGRFRIACDKGVYAADSVIVAAGGPAAPALGGSMSGRDILASFGHTILPMRPSLVQIKTDSPYPRMLKGVKAAARIRIFEGGVCLADVTDELLFTEYGLSGPAALNASRGNHFDDKARKFYAELDLLHEYSHERARNIMDRLCSRNVLCEDILSGLMHKKLGKMLVKHAGLPFTAQAHTLSQAELDRLTDSSKRFRLDISGTTGFENAQAASGGAVLNEFDENLESRLVSGLFAAGEVLNADGPCGGYNLQWAWSSGAAAGGRLAE